METDEYGNESHFVCEHCGEETSWADLNPSPLEQATGWIECPECHAVNVDE